MCHSIYIYRLFVLNFWWHRHREYQLVAKSTVPCFFSSCYFHNVGYSTVVCPRCAPGFGGYNANLGGTLKKLFRRFAPEFCAPKFKTVSAPMGCSQPHTSRSGDIKSSSAKRRNARRLRLENRRNASSSLKLMYLLRVPGVH